MTGGEKIVPLAVHPAPPPAPPPRPPFRRTAAPPRPPDRNNPSPEVSHVVSRGHPSHGELRGTLRGDQVRDAADGARRRRSFGRLPRRPAGPRSPRRGAREDPVLAARRLPRLLAGVRAVAPRDERIQRDAGAKRPRVGSAGGGRPLPRRDGEAVQLDRGAARDGGLFRQSDVPRARRRRQAPGDPRAVHARGQDARGRRPGQSPRPLDHRRPADGSAAAVRRRHGEGRRHVAAGRRELVARDERRRSGSLDSVVGRTGEPHEPRVPVRAYGGEQQDRGARLRAGRARRGARVALRARHSLAADRGDAGGESSEASSP